MSATADITKAVLGLVTIVLIVFAFIYVVGLISPEVREKLRSSLAGLAGGTVNEGTKTAAETYEASENGLIDGVFESVGGDSKSLDSAVPSNSPLLLPGLAPIAWGTKFAAWWDSLFSGSAAPAAQAPQGSSVSDYNPNLAPDDLPAISQAFQNWS